MAQAKKKMATKTAKKTTCKTCKKTYKSCTGVEKVHMCIILALAIIAGIFLAANVAIMNA